jgi:rRNA-processing protein FCF1
VKKQHTRNAGKSLHVIGYRINFDADRSVLVDPCLDQCEVVFALESDVSHLREKLRSKQFVNLVDLYQQGKKRIDVYQNVADKVLAAFAMSSKVGLLVEGSPFFLDTICELLEKRAISAGIDVIYVDGRSSLDGIIQLLRIPLSWGIGVHIADNFCFSRPVIDPEAINMFFQPGNVGSDKVQMAAVDVEGTRLLQSRLLEYYSPADRWILVNLGESRVRSTKIVWGTLDRLDHFTQLMHSGTLVVSKNWWPKLIR